MSAESPDAARPRAAATPVPITAPVLNVANALTVSRLVLVPFFLLALFADGGINTGWRWVASVIFAVASITDHVDGNIARSRNLVTDFGKIADPIADKALTGGALVGLSALGQLPWWVTIVIAVREVGVTLLRFWVIRYGVISATRGGKAKTLFQIIAIGLFVLPLPHAVLPFSWGVMDVALGLTVLTGVDYVFRAVRLRVSSKRTTSASAHDTSSDDRAA